jgi:hypothetical protein
MPAGSLESALLDGLAGFAGTLVDPLVLAPVLAAGTLVASPARARLAAAAVGLAHGLWELATATGPIDRPATLLGSLAAAALLVELVLQVLLPLARLALRCLALLGALLDRRR